MVGDGVLSVEKNDRHFRKLEMVCVAKFIT